MKVSEIMTGQLATVDRSDSVAFAEDMMNANRVRHLPVVDGDVLVGIVTQRDVLAASVPSVSAPSEDDDREMKSRLRVERIMRGYVETVAPDSEAIEAADRLLLHKIGCLPVVDERKHVLGIVTEADFVRLARDLLVALEEARARVSERRTRRAR